MPNPKCRVNAITLCTKEGSVEQKTDLETQGSESDPENHASGREFPHADIRVFSVIQQESAYDIQQKSACSPGSVAPAVTSLPFPTELKKPKKNMELDEDLMKLFSNVKISIPLTDAIKHIPMYAKFLKE